MLNANSTDNNEYKHTAWKVYHGLQACCNGLLNDTILHGQDPTHRNAIRQQKLHQKSIG